MTNNPLITNNFSMMNSNWQKIAEAFKQLQCDEKIAGGTLVVYHNNQCVIDTSIGNSHSDKAWHSDTLSLNYSTGKGILATLVHCLVSQKLLDYDTPIAHYWQAFAVNGKQAITLRQVMSHQAKLFSINSIINDAHEILDWDLMVQKVANIAPTAIQPKENIEYSSAYSALVYGWILGGLITKVTSLSLQEALDTYLAKPLDIQGQIYFKLPEHLVDKVAQPERRFYLLRESDQESSTKKSRRKPILKADSEHALQVYQQLPCYQQWQDLYQQKTGVYKEVLTRADINGLYFDPSLINLANYQSSLMASNKQPLDYYEPDVLKASIPAVNCVASAKALAIIYNMMAQGGTVAGHEFINADSFQNMTKIHSHGADAIMPSIAPNSMLWRLGYHRVFSRRYPDNDGFGHMGYNASMAWCNPSCHLAVAFTHNMESIMLNDIRGIAINEMILACIYDSK